MWLSINKARSSLTSFNVTNHKFLGESWILVQSVTPSDVKQETTQAMLDTTTETKMISSTPLITLTTLSDNITNEITSADEETSTEKIRETTLEPSSSEEIEDSSEYIAVTGSSSEYPSESDEEEETTTESLETDTDNSNLTTLVSSGNVHTNHLLIYLITVECLSLPCEQSISCHD